MKDKNQLLEERKSIFNNHGAALKDIVISHVDILKNYLKESAVMRIDANLVSAKCAGNDNIAILPPHQMRIFDTANNLFMEWCIMKNSQMSAVARINTSNPDSYYERADQPVGFICSKSIGDQPRTLYFSGLDSIDKYKEKGEPGGYRLSFSGYKKNAKVCTLRDLHILYDVMLHPNRLEIVVDNEIDINNLVDWRYFPLAIYANLAFHEIRI